MDDRQPTRDASPAAGRGCLLTLAACLLAWSLIGLLIWTLLR